MKVLRIISGVVLGLILTTLVLAIGWLLLTSDGAAYAVRHLSFYYLGSTRVVWDRLDGGLWRGVTVRDLQVDQLPVLPEGSVLRVQTVSLRLVEFSVYGLRLHVENARLSLRSEDPVVLNLEISSGRIKGNIFTRDLDLVDIRQILASRFALPELNGRLTGLDLEVGGTLRHPWVRGHCVVRAIRRNDFRLEDATVRSELNFLRQGTNWGTYGTLDVDSGILSGPVLKFDIVHSRLKFAGDLLQPEINIHAVTRVGRTRIDIDVRGSRREPQIVLTSVPTYSREILFLMLATGRNWTSADKIISGTGANQAIGQSGSPLAAAYLVDYILFGGSRLKLIRGLGLSNIALLADNGSQAVEVSKDLSERLGITYGAGRYNTLAGQRQWAQHLESDYHLTDNFLFSVRKEISGGAVSGPGADKTGRTDDSFTLRYKTSF